MKSISLSLILLLLSSFSWADEENDSQKVDEYKIALEAFLTVIIYCVWAKGNGLCIAMKMMHLGC